MRGFREPFTTTDWLDGRTLHTVITDDFGRYGIDSMVFTANTLTGAEGSAAYTINNDGDLIVSAYDGSANEYVHIISEYQQPTSPYDYIAIEWTDHYSDIAVATPETANEFLFYDLAAAQLFISH